MSYPTCTHILTKGTYCQSPALTGDDLCYYHSREYQRKANLNQARELKNSDHFYKYPLQQEALNPDIIESLDIPALDDAESVQVALTNVIRALVSGHITDKKAGLALFGLQIAAGNARRVSLKIYSHEDAATDDPQPLAALVNVPIYPAGHSDELKAQAAAKRTATRDASSHESENETPVASPSDESTPGLPRETENEHSVDSVSAPMIAAAPPAAPFDGSTMTGGCPIDSQSESVGERETGGTASSASTSTASSADSTSRETCNVQRETGNATTGQRTTPLAPNARERLQRAAVRLAGKPNSKTFAQHIKLAAALHQGKLNATEFLKEQKQEQTNGTSSQ